MATLAELAFPVTSVIVNLYFVSPAQTTSPWEIVGIALLWIAIAALDIENARRPAWIGPAEQVVEQRGALVI